MQQLHTANRKPVTQADLNALKAKVDSLLATNARRPAGPPPTQAEINHEIKRQLAPVLVDLQEAGFDTREVEANLQRLTTNAQDWRSQYQPPAADDNGYIAPELLDDKPSRQGAANFDHVSSKYAPPADDGYWDSYDPYAAAEEGQQ